MQVYNETASLRPKQGDPNSADKLCEGRRRIAGIAYGEPGRVAPPKEPELYWPPAIPVWEDCLHAAFNPIPPGDTRHFVIWFSNDGGKTPAPGIPGRWAYTQTDKITIVYGPVHNSQFNRDEYFFFYKGVP